MKAKTKTTKTPATKATKAKSKSAVATTDSKAPAGSLNIKDACTFFGVGHMTIFNWRRGTVRKTRLPFHTVKRGERDEVFFKLSELRKWAKENDVATAQDVKTK